MALHKSYVPERLSENSLLFKQRVVLNKWEVLRWPGPVPRTFEFYYFWFNGRQARSQRLPYKVFKLGTYTWFACSHNHSDSFSRSLSLTLNVTHVMHIQRFIRRIPKTRVILTWDVTSSEISCFKIRTTDGKILAIWTSRCALIIAPPTNRRWQTYT